MNTLDLSTRLQIPVHVMARQVGQDTVILDLATGNYYGLDPVGARIWELLTQGQTLEQVCAALLAEFDVTRPQLERDARELVQTLLDRQLVQLGT